mmetsp:Transcript_205/g.539  ORF Transcript_205/g.539 Transcript_205/m.539 type:complete len:205 (+) Transcript_205:55-669(+)
MDTLVALTNSADSFGSTRNRSPVVDATLPSLYRVCFRSSRLPPSEWTMGWCSLTSFSIWYSSNSRRRSSLDRTWSKKASRVMTRPLRSDSSPRFNASKEAWTSVSAATFASPLARRTCSSTNSTRTAGKTSRSAVTASSCLLRCTDTPPRNATKAFTRALASGSVASASFSSSARKGAAASTAVATAVFASPSHNNSESASRAR